MHGHNAAKIHSNRYLLAGSCLSCTGSQISSKSVKDHFNIMIANQRALMKAPQYRNDPSKLVFMRIQPDIATLIYKLDPQFAQFRAHDGSLVVELGQALYGCIQSALHWHTLGFFAFFAP